MKRLLLLLALTTNLPFILKTCNTQDKNYQHYRLSSITNNDILLNNLFDPNMHLKRIQAQFHIIQDYKELLLNPIFQFVIILEK